MSAVSLRYLDAGDELFSHSTKAENSYVIFSGTTCAAVGGHTGAPTHNF